MGNSTSRRRGPSPLPPDQLRQKRLSVYVTDSELVAIQIQARQVQMAPPAYLRAAGLNILPPTIPEINRQAWATLAKAAGNLATISTAMRGGEYIQLEELRIAVNEFRQALIGVVHERDAED